MICAMFILGIFEKLKFWQQKSKRALKKHTLKRPGIPRHNYLYAAPYISRRAKDSRPRTIFETLFQETAFNTVLALCYLLVLTVVLFAPSPLFESPRWQPLMDMNRDGLFTITDLFYWCFWLFYLPGDVVLSVLLQFDGPSRFFELYSESYGGLGSLVMSSLYWWTLGGANMLFLGLTPIIIQTFLRQP